VSAFGIHNLVKEYLKQGLKIDENDSQGKTALHIAASNGHVRTVELLVDLGCSVELRDNTGHEALDHAVLAGSLAAVRFCSEVVHVAKLLLASILCK